MNPFDEILTMKEMRELVCGRKNNVSEDKKALFVPETSDFVAREVLGESLVHQLLERFYLPEEQRRKFAAILNGHEEGLAQKILSASRGEIDSSAGYVAAMESPENAQRARGGELYHAAVILGGSYGEARYAEFYVLLPAESNRSRSVNVGNVLGAAELALELSSKSEHPDNVSEGIRSFYKDKGASGLGISAGSFFNAMGDYTAGFEELFSLRALARKRKAGRSSLLLPTRSLAKLITASELAAKEEEFMDFAGDDAAVVEAAGRISPPGYFKDFAVSAGDVFYCSYFNHD